MPIVEYLARSMKYVRGETDEIALPQAGSSSTGRKTPLMKTRGNLTSEESIITVAGTSVGG